MKQNQYQGIDTIANQLAKIKLGSLRSLFNKYRKRTTRKPISPDTIERAERAMNTLIHFTNDMPPGQIDSDIVDNYIKNELNRGLEPGGINTNLRHLKAIFNWANKTDLIKDNPFRDTNPLETEEKQIRVLSKSEIKRFISVIDDEFYKTLIWCYLLTGARRSELLSPKLSWKHIDLEQGVMFILVKGSGKKRRRVTLATPLIDMLTTLKKRESGDRISFRC
jgi:integrase